MKKEKILIRKEYLKIRNAISYEMLEYKSTRIYDRLVSLDEIKSAKNIMAYHSIGTEVDTNLFIKHELINTGSIILPVCIPEELLIMPYRIDNMDKLVAGAYGIMEPSIECCSQVEPGKIDTVVMPGLVFDKKGNRLGYGKGYYDRFLSKNKQTIKIALSFQEQIVDILHTHSFDVPVDIIVTDKKNYYIKND